MISIVNFELKWIKENPSAEMCGICNEPIYSNTYRLGFMINSNISKTEFVVCESCNELIK